MLDHTCRHIVGLMSGTSVDGVDAALVRIAYAGTQTDWELIAFETYPYSAPVRKRILDACQSESSDVRLICELNFELGQLFVGAIEQICKRAGMSLDQIDLVGSHGQTVYHQPASAQAGIASTLQIGEAAVIAQHTGIPTVADFRVADMAVGGEGAPLVPYVDYLLFRKQGSIRALQNLGGIGNVTYLSDALAEVCAFDTGPGNMLLDSAMSHFTGKPFDRDGAFASGGQVNTDLLAHLMRHPFLGQSPPKSTGREMFGQAYLSQIINLASERGITPQDTLATLTAFTADSVVDAYRRFFPRTPREVLVSGGGSHNHTLMQRLRQRLAPIPVLTTDVLRCPVDAKEAIAFAVLANEFVSGNPSNLPQVTRATKRVLMGKLIPGTRPLKFPGLLTER